MNQRFFVQPAWLDFSIFWAVVVSGIGLAIILQLEIGAYDTPVWPAAALLGAVLVLAVVQVWRTKLTIGPAGFTLRRILPSNTITQTAEDVRAITVSGHTVRVDTRHYGTVVFVHLGRMERLQAALAALTPAVINEAKGEHHVRP